MRHVFRFSILVLVALNAQLSADDFVGIPNEEFAEHYRAQKGEYLCWATCAEMVLSHQGITLPADAIVEKIKGYKADETGNHGEMIKATNGIFADENDQKVMVSGQMVLGAPISTVLYTSLKNQKPIILLYQNGPTIGHAVVITGADVEVNTSTDKVTVRKWHVFDPYSYRRVADFTQLKGYRLEEDASLVRKEYHPRQNFSNGRIQIEAGVVTAVIIIEGAEI